MRPPQIRHVLRRVDKHGRRFLGLAVRGIHFVPARPLPPEVSGRARGRQGGHEQKGLPSRENERVQPLRDGQFQREQVGRVHSVRRRGAAGKKNAALLRRRGQNVENSVERMNLFFERNRGAFISLELSLFPQLLRVAPPASVRVG